MELRALRKLLDEVEPKQDWGAPKANKDAGSIHTGGFVKNIRRSIGSEEGLFNDYLLLGLRRGFQIFDFIFQIGRLGTEYRA